jgi:hypothetical protein
MFPIVNAPLWVRPEMRGAVSSKSGGTLATGIKPRSKPISNQCKKLKWRIQEIMWRSSSQNEGHTSFTNRIVEAELKRNGFPP